jgi:hypothetical protein
VNKLNPSIRWYYEDVLDLLLKGQQVKGWKPIPCKSRKVDGFYNKKLGVVIKRPVFILEHRTPMEFRFPTYFLQESYVLQPLAERKNLRLALQILRGKLKKYLKYGIFPDLHTGNIGWYQGKPLMFDW